MAVPPFYLQIVDANGIVVRTHAGGRHEADLIELCVQSILSKGVGILRTEAHVAQDIRTGIADALYGLKIQNPFDTVDE